MQSDEFVYVANEPGAGEDELTKIFADSMEEGVLRDAMDLDADPTDSRLQNDNEEISNVVLSPSGCEVSIEYEVEASCHYGCADVSRTLHKSFVIYGTLENGFWQFPRHIPPAMRTTLVEF